MDSAFSVSQTEVDDEQGYAASIALSRDFRNWSFGLSSRYFTQEYQYLSGDVYDSNIEASNILYFNFSNLRFIDGLNLSYIYQSYYDQNGFSNDTQKIFDIRDRKSTRLNSSHVKIS